MNAIAKLTAILGVSLLVVFSCSRQIPDTVSPPINEPIPSTPSNLTITVGDRLANLSWSVDDTTDIKLFRIYISDSSDTNYRVLTEVTQTSYTAPNLRNGRAYYFKVSSVNWAEFEGYACPQVMAIPNLFGLIINDGQQYTNSRDVTLSLMAPVGTQYMQLSNDSTFEGSAWEIFASSKIWTLSSGDNLKFVYVRYRLQSDDIATVYNFASITLDTRAVIDSVVFTPSGSPLRAGDHIHFKLFAGEPDGIAEVTVGQNLINQELYDDGARGDAVAGDGIYEADYTVAGNLDFNNSSVVGNFTDRATNNAQQVQAGESMSVLRAPEPVSIFGIIAPTGFFNRLEIQWNAVQISDFAQYRIYRGLAAGVDSSDYLARVIGSAGTTSLLDTGLTQNTVYYYRVFVIDNTGLWAGSNEVHARTNQNTPPEPVVLYPPVTPPGSYDRLSLTWSASNDQDFLRYELYRSYDNQVNNSDILILSSTSQTSAEDTSLADDSIYYYSVLTMDQSGNSTWSNVVSGRTGIDSPPDPAILYPVELAPDYYQDIRLQWSQPYTPDFEVYRLYSWRPDGGRADSTLLAVITNQDSMTYLDHPVFNAGYDTLNYYYIIYTIDRGGNRAISNILRVHLVDTLPGLVTGVVIIETASLSISWTPTAIPDFSNYLLTRDTLAVPTQSIPVFSSVDQNTSSFSDENLVRGHTYYYWLTINDRRGHSSRSFIGSAPW
jgi:fibronectin type 3 domain-containing protein